MNPMRNLRETMIIDKNREWIFVDCKMEIMQVILGLVVLD
jgi:hypothetical protein